MTQVELTQEICAVEHGDIQALMKQAEQEYYATCVPIDIRFAPEEENLMAEYFPDCEVERLDDREWRIILRVPMRERLWKALLLSFGDKVRVAGPAEYVEELRRIALAFAQKHKEN